MHVGKWTISNRGLNITIRTQWLSVSFLADTDRRCTSRTLCFVTHCSCHCLSFCFLLVFCKSEFPYESILDILQGPLSTRSAHYKTCTYRIQHKHIENIHICPERDSKSRYQLSAALLFPQKKWDRLHLKSLFVCPANHDHPDATGLAYYKALSLSASLHGSYTIMFSYFLKEVNNSPVVGILISRTFNKAAIRTGQALHLVCPRCVLEC